MIATQLFWIVFNLSILSKVSSTAYIKQINYAPPVPGLPVNTDPTKPTIKTTTTPAPIIFSENYLPAVMQAIAYYVDLLQYEPLHKTTIEPPFTLSQKDETSKAPKPVLGPTTPMPSTTVRIPETTPPHRPGYYAPAIPQSIAEPMEPVPAIKPITGKPQLGVLPLLSISHMEFFDWFLQGKYKISPEFSDYDLQNLDPLPSKLLQDIQNERYEPPTLLDQDNVNEFLRVYDDFYGRSQPETGRKRVPPTKPYVQMLMLYDLLKREAKRMQLNKFSGYTPEMIIELNETANGSAERQLYTLMKRMIDRKDVDKPDVNVRVQSILEDLVNPYTVTAMSLRYIPPLVFLP